MMMIMLMMMMMMMIKQGGAATVKVVPVSVQSGMSILLPSQPLRSGTGHMMDVRWTHPKLMLSRHNNRSMDGRCELQQDGSLSFSRIYTEDAGNYTVEVFDPSGKRMGTLVFLLTVYESSESSEGDTSLFIYFLLLAPVLLVFIIIFFIVRRRGRSHGTRMAGRREDNIYMSMHGPHGNNKKEEKEEKEKEEEPVYVPCGHAISMETPITQQEEEDVYV